MVDRDDQQKHIASLPYIKFCNSFVQCHTHHQQWIILADVPNNDRSHVSENSLDSWMYKGMT